MSDRDRHDVDTRLERAIEALRDQPAADTPPQHLQAATLRALQDLTEDPRPRAANSKGNPTMLVVKRLTGLTAATLAVGLLVFLFLAGSGSALTFAEVLSKLQESRSVRFLVTMQIAGAQPQEHKVWIQDDIVRQEVSEEFVIIVDTNQRQGIQVFHDRKAVERLDLTNRIPAEELSDPLNQLRNLKEQEGVRVTQGPDELVGQKTCHVFQIDGAKALQMQGEWKLWVDPETALPVKMQLESDNITVTFEDLVWDERLDANLFSLNAPEGYTVVAPIAAELRPGQISYHVGRDFHTVRPDGTQPQRQFIPEAPGPSGYASDKAELSPDGRHLTLAYSAHRDGAAYPPERILMWDRTQPDQDPVEVYAHPGAELSHWRYTADGRRLYVAWWKQVPEKQWPHGVGADYIDLESGERTEIKLPTFTTDDGQEFPTQFADVSPDGSTYLVVGRQLQLISAEGESLRYLTEGEGSIDPSSVRFSPDGEHVLFVRVRRDSGYELAKVPVSGGEPQILAAAGQFAGIRARWSPDGKRVAFSSREYAPNHPRRYGDEAYLNIVNADGSELQTVIRENAPPNAISMELTAWR